jgi:hypothetical protein
MIDSSRLTDDDAFTAIKYLSGGLGDLCLVKIKCLNKGSGEVTRPNICSVLRQSQIVNGIYPLASEEASDTEAILFTSLYAQKFLKLIRKLNRTNDSLTFEVAVTLVGSADAFDFYQKATYQAQDFIQMVLKAVNRRFRGVI